MFLEICMQIRSVVQYLHLADQLTSRKYAKSINLVAQVIKFSYQAQEGSFNPQHPPFANM